MSGVPQKPYAFATGAAATYPAGVNPWNGQPTRVAPGVAYLTPGASAKPTAQGLNYVMGQNSDAAINLWTELGAFACQNWRGTQGVPVSGTQWSRVCYDASDNSWVGLVRTSGTPDTVSVVKSYDGGKSWTTAIVGSGLPVYGTGTVYPLGIFCAGPGEYLVVTYGALTSGTSGITISLTTPGASIWTIEHSFTETLTLTGAGNGYDADLSLFNFTYILVNNDSDAASGSQTGFYSSPDAVTWAAQAVPTTLGNSSTHLTPGWTRSAQSANIWLILQRGLTGTQATNCYMYTTDGSTFSVGTLPGAVQGASDLQAALAYGPGASGTGMFMAAIQMNGGGTRLAKSTDGLTWTVITSLTTQNITDLVAFGAAWVAVVDAEAGGGSTAAIIYSLDDGAHWQRGTAMLGQNASTSTAGYCRAKISASPMGLAIQNTNAVDLSFETGTVGKYVS